MNYCSIKVNSGSKDFDGLASGMLTAGSKEDLIDIIKSEMLGSYIADLDHVVTKIDVLDALNTLKPLILANGNVSLAELLFIINNFNKLFSVYSENIFPEDKINFDNRAKLFSVLNANLNQFLFSEINSDLFRFTVYDPVSNVITASRDDLNTSIKNYKNELFHILIDFISSELGTTELIKNLESGDLYEISGDGMFNADLYAEVMRFAKNKIKSLTIAGPINSGISIDTIQNILLPVKAFYLLNNFDAFIETIGDGDILISPQLRGKLEIYQDKYTLKDQVHKRGSFNDSLKDVDANNLTGKLFQKFFQTIQKNLGEFCTIADLNSIFKHVLNLISENATFTYGNLGQEVGFSFIYNPNISASEKSNMLIHALRKSKELRKRISVNVADSVAEAIDGFNSAFKEAIKTKSIKERKEFTHKFDFAQQFIHEILTHQHAAYLAVTKEGVKAKSDTKVLRGKNHIVDELKRTLLENLSVGRWQLYNPRYLVGGNRTISTFNDIYSPTFLKYVLDLTGINIASENLQQLLLTTSGVNKLTLFIIDLNRTVRNEILPYRGSKNFEEIVDSALDRMKKKKGHNPFVAFTDLLISDNENENIQIRDQQGNNNPTQNVPNTIGDFSKNLIEYEKWFGTTSPTDIFHTFKGLTSSSSSDVYSYTDRILYRLDFAVNGGKKIIAARQLTSDEICSVALNNDFLEGIQNYHTFFNQIECVSDKPRIPVGAFNVNALYKGKIPFYKLTRELLRDVYYEQHYSYFNKIKNDLIQDYNNLFGTRYLSIDDCIAHLETLHLSWFNNTFSGSFITIGDFKKDGKDLNNEKLFVKEFNTKARTAFKEWEECKLHFHKQGWVNLYKMMKSWNKLHPDNRIELKDQIHYVSTKDGLRFNNSLYVNIAAAGNKELLNKLLDDGFEDTKLFIKEKAVPLLAKVTDETLIKDLFSDVSEKDLKQFFNQKRWYQEQNGQISDASNKILEKWFLMLQLCTDADLMVSIKQPYIHEQNKGHLPVSQLKVLRTSDWATANFKSLYKEMSARMVKGKKRNNSAVASYEPMMQNRTYGVGNTMRIATVESMETDLYTYNGFVVKGLAVHDGGTFINGIHSQWEAESYPGKDYHGTGKTIGLFPNGATFTLFKHAEFVITNALIRNSFKNKDLYHYDFGKIFEKMNRADISDLIRNYQASGKPSLGYEIYKYLDNGNMAILDSLELAENNSAVVWKDLSTGEIVTDKNLQLNTVYDLWNALGGANSLSKDENGVIRESEISQIVTADLISEFGNKIKEQVIAKVSDVSACKSGITNLNPQSVMIDDEDFEFFTADTSRMGVQLDYGHEADESLIPALTQVLTALSFNGENIELCNSIYEDLGLILENSLRPLKLAWNKDKENHKDFHIKLAKDLMESLKRSVVSSNAMDIVRESLQSLIEEAAGLGIFKQLPYSSPEIFAKVTTDFVANLNSNSLRLKFSGIAIIQNPSHGIIGVYEDHAGNRYTRTDLLLWGRELGFAGTPETIINLVLSRSEFSEKEIISADYITIGDWVRIEEKGKSRFKEIRTPYDLQEVDKVIKNSNEENQNKVYQQFSILRDLKPTNITFVDAYGVLRSLWMLDSTIKKLSNPKNREYLQYYRANLREIGNKENPAYYASYEDYLSGVKTNISQVVYKAGEQIIPKINKSALGLYDSIATIKRSGVSYFVDKIKRDIDKLTNLKASENNWMLICVTPDQEIVYTNESAQETAIEANLLNGQIIQEDDKYYLVNSLGDKIVEVTEPGVRYTTQTLNNGKELVIIYESEDLKNNIAVIASKNRNVTAYYDGGKFGGFCARFNELDLRPKKIDESIAKYAEKLYNSFLMSNYTVSARIPSQAFQSFMANETIAFTEDDSNNGYVNVYEIIFQGSDFDIKKYWCR